MRASQQKIQPAIVVIVSPGDRTTFNARQAGTNLGKSSSPGGESHRSAEPDKQRTRHKPDADAPCESRRKETGTDGHIKEFELNHIFPARPWTPCLVVAVN